MFDRRRVLSVRVMTMALWLTAFGCHGSPPHDPAASTAPGVDERALDTRISPCDDFYQYACGGWIASTPIPEDQPAWTRSFDVIQEENEVRMRDILERDAKAPSAEPYAKALGDFYAACMDEEGIERTSSTAIAPEFARIDAVTNLRELAREVARLQLTGVDALFGVGSGQDYADATQVIGIVSQGGLGMPDRDYYLADDAPRRKIRDEYLHHIERLLVLAGEKPEEAAAHAITVLTFEHALAEASMSKEDRRDPKKTYHRIDRAGLDRVAGLLAWDDYFSELGFPSIQAINVEQPDFLAALNRLLGSTPNPPPVTVTPPSTIASSPTPSSTAPPIASQGTPPAEPLSAVPLADIRAYLRVHWLIAAAPRLGARFVDENFRFRRVLTGAARLLPRWKRCVRATDVAMGEALGRPFVKETLGTEGKARAKEMVGAIEERMRESLGRVPWMDATTRARALEKLGLVANKIGYPDVWRNYDALIIGRESYLANMQHAEAFEARRELAKIGKPLDRGEWQMSPPTVNAYYDASMNEMVFPAGILQSPFYANDAPNSVNFGGIGMVMGHELSHGFDDEGRQFDGHGNLVEWWTKSSAAEFDRRAACVAKQYDGYVAIDDIHVNGRLTLGENIADLGGVKLAYAAFEKTKSSGSTRFTAPQEFFLGYAQSWCSTLRPEFLRLRVATNPHSPAKFRVNGPLSNLPEFAEAFQCKEGSPMVRPPADRCEVW